MNNTNRPFNRMSVRHIQSSLTNISRIDSDIPRVNPDGIYGETTADAVYAFQKKYMDGGDGRVDFLTWQELTRIAKEADKILSPSSPISPFELTLKDGKLVKGDRCSLIALIKIMMNSISITYPSAEDLGDSELFDERLYNAIMDFQVVHGLKANGEIDKQTWNRLALAYDRSLWAD